MTSEIDLNMTKRAKAKELLVIIQQKNIPSAIKIIPVLLSNVQNAQSESCGLVGCVIDVVMLLILIKSGYILLTRD